LSVSVVNGFKCYSSCDEAKARSGKDPHPKAQTTTEEQSQEADRFGSESAVTFGGALTGLDAVPPVLPSEIPTTTNVQTGKVLDILA
jgi:hypothetical protein